jgi:DNA processing protein
MKDRGLLDLIISLLPGIMPAGKIKLLEHFEHEEQLYTQTKWYIEELLNCRINSDWDINEIRDRADRIDTVCAMRKINWVSWAEREYPPLLREIYDPPSVIFYRGNLPDPEKSLLGMVGTRRPSPEAAAQAFTLSCGAANAGISVVSGLALGIDAICHRGNISGGAPGYAVLGCGIDGIYPQSNKPLAKKILDSSGAIISEYPPGTRPAKWRFPARNRIIAALSRSVIIVEAPKKSGALITAAFALEQGKDLWVASTGAHLRDTLYDKRGTYNLVQDGAEIIYSHRDIIDKWNMPEDKVNSSVFPSGLKSREELVSFMANFLKIDV